MSDSYLAHKKRGWKSCEVNLEEMYLLSRVLLCMEVHTQDLKNMKNHCGNILVSRMGHRGQCSVASPILFSTGGCQTHKCAHFLSPLISFMDCHFSTELEAPVFDTGHAT